MPIESKGQATGRSSMREVAELAGVAMSSVSRVLSDHPDVSDRMRKRVTSAVEELGYEPDILAQSLRLKMTKTVGFVVGDISNPLLAEIALGAEMTLRSAGHSTMLTNSENDPELDARHVRLLLQRRVDGLLLSLASESHEETAHEIERAGVPAVLIDRDLSPAIGASAVLSDHYRGMRAAIDHLLDLGHSRIGMVLGQELRFSRERKRGLEEALAARGLPATAGRVLTGELTPTHGREATARLLDEADGVTALVAGGNQLVVGVIAELQHRGIEIGREMSLVSCDEVSLTQLYLPPIAIISRDNREIGRQAADVLLGHLRTETQPRSVILPTEFVPRPSCQPPPAR